MLAESQHPFFSSVFFSSVFNMDSGVRQNDLLDAPQLDQSFFRAARTTKVSLALQAVNGKVLAENFGRWMLCDRVLELKHPQGALVERTLASVLTEAKG